MAAFLKGSIKRSAAPLVAAGLLLIGCSGSQSTGPKQTSESFADLQVSPDFTWSASTEIDLQVQLEAHGAYPVSTDGTLLELVDGAGTMLAKSMVQEGRARFALKAPVGTQGLRLRFPATGNTQSLTQLSGVITMPVSYLVYGQDNGLSYWFPSTESVVTPKMTAGDNLIEDGNFDQEHELPYVESLNGLLSVRSRWYKTHLQQTAWEPKIHSGQLDIGHPQLGEQSAVLQDINVGTGKQVTLSLNLRQPAANEGVRADIVLSALDATGPGSVLAMHSIDSGPTEYKSWTAVTITGVTPSWSQGVRVMIVCLPSTKQFSVQTAVEVTTASLQDGGPPPDSDGDGVDDSIDEFPNDPTRVLSNLVPCQGYTVSAFEDMWPAKGDYDFNDAVLHHRIVYQRDVHNRLVSASVNMTISALGAGYHSGIAMRFLQPTTTTPTGYQTMAAGLVSSVSGAGVRLDPQSPNTLILTDDAFASLPTYYQNNGEGPTGTPVLVTFQVNFNTSHPAAAGEVNGEFFIFLSNARGHEVHLPNYPPTPAADLSLLGTQDDRSDPATTSYYRTANYHPWGLEIVLGDTQFLHPLERVSIVQAYPGFASWAESNGQTSKNWYRSPVNSLVFHY
jgi:LruC domain-containing protein